MNVFTETKANEEKKISMKIFCLQYNCSFSLHNSILLPVNIKNNFLWLDANFVKE